MCIRDRVDEALAGLCFVHSCYEVCRTVGLPELDVVEHALLSLIHIYKKEEYVADK